jgi:uncharacterized protein (DUF305 family)
MPTMTRAGAPVETRAPAPTFSGRDRWLAAAAVVLALAVGLTIGLIVPVLSRPADDSAEAGFLRDMSTHHAQAVEMAMIAHEKATDPTVRIVAADIALTQHGQINIMQTWLRDWKLNLTGSEPPMAWMPDAAGAVRDGLMPGMASQEQLAALRAATGKQVDIQFLTLMGTHHLGGIHMAQAISDLSDNDKVTNLAGTMVTSQQGELATIKDLLEKVRGAA